MSGPRITRARHFQWRRPLGRFASYVTADQHRLGVHLNRYPHKIIGVSVVYRRRCLSWVWPIEIRGVKLTREQFDRQARQVIDGERP